jgi:hypothetical protein
MEAQQGRVKFVGSCFEKGCSCITSYGVILVMLVQVYKCTSELCSLNGLQKRNRILWDYFFLEVIREPGSRFRSVTERVDVATVLFNSHFLHHCRVFSIR